MARQWEQCVRVMRVVRVGACGGDVVGVRVVFIIIITRYYYSLLLLLIIILDQ